MTLSTKAEISLLRDDERDAVSRTHFPAILDNDDTVLGDLRTRLRSLHEKERTLTHQVHRSARGKAEPRGGSFPGSAERASRRKQVFASALKRANREASRRRALAAREAMKNSAQRALRLKQESADAPTPDPGRTNSQGLTSLENRKRHWALSRANVGRVSQAGKRAQAARDARPT